MNDQEQKLLKEGFQQTPTEELAGYADIDEAELALQGLRRYAWRPAEDAPARETVIVGSCGKVGAGWRDDKGDWFVYGTTIKMEKPTHYMPLPSPPIDEQIENESIEDLNSELQRRGFDLGKVQKDADKLKAILREQIEKE